jgi:pimeloyl-ACP methyl ester carboxylesterase
LGLLERLFVLDTAAAERTCAWMCAHRGMAQAFAVATNPYLPMQVASMGAQHTWPSYLGTLTGVVLHNALDEPLRRLEQSDVRVSVALGSRDRLSDARYARSLVDRFKNCHLTVVPGTHHLPLERPAWCARQLVSP